MNELNKATSAKPKNMIRIKNKNFKITIPAISLFSIFFRLL
jgi:hypothetical protein